MAETNERDGIDQTPDPESAADDRFVHGLLEFMHKDGQTTREARVQTVMSHIDGHARGGRHRRFLAALVPLATAAVIAIVAVTMLVVTPQPAAYAMVDAAIVATRSAPELRYEIGVVDRAGEPERALGELDMRGELLLVRIATPHGHDFVMGRDAQGEWSLRRDGSVERSDPRGAAPRWIDLGDSTILVGSLDGLLGQLRDEFTIERSAGASGPTLVATRRDDAQGPGPDRVEIWVDASTSLVERLELHTDRPMPGPREGAPGGRRGPGGEDRGPPPREGGPPPPGGHPELIHGRPDFGQGRRPPPPSRIIFQRAQPRGLGDDAFSPPVSPDG